MPDLVEDALGRVHASRRRFRLLMVTAVAALILAAAAFTFSLQANWQHTHQATADAQAATIEARKAAAEARAALRQAYVNQAALCVFLAAAQREAPHEAAGDAQALFRAYHCPQPHGG